VRPLRDDIEATPGLYGLGAALLDAADATQDLIVAQIAVTKAELRSDAARLALGSALLLVGVGSYFLGHGLIVLAVGLALVRVVDPMWAAAIIGLPHLLLGAVAVALASRHLSTLADPGVP